MLYFNTLPKIFTTDESGNVLLLTNILTRAKIIDSLQNNPLLFYEYAIQNGDTPEIISHKYYGDPYKYWIILYSNQILDPIWQWPMDDNVFDQYINVKYATQAAAENKTPFEYATSTVYRYEKWVTTTDLTTGVPDVKKYNINQETYNSLMPSTNTYTLPNNTTVTVEISKNIVYIYDQEIDVNESRRQIKILNESYMYRMEEQLKLVMGT